MRVAAACLLLCASLPAAAEPAAAPAAGAPAAATEKVPLPAPKPEAAKRQAAKPAAPKPPPVRAAYDTMPLAERIAIQSDLAWTNDYNGIADGDFRDSSIAAVKAYQKRRGGKDTGILTPEERTALADSARGKQGNVGWMLIVDSATGARMGLPAKLVPRASNGKSGMHWQSAHGDVQIETFRESAPATLAAVYEQQKKNPGRRVEYNVFRPDMFVLSGLQGLKKFYMRAQAKGDEVRGMLILYDQATEGIMEPVAVAMSSAFVPFPASDSTGPVARRKVEYATGVVVSPAGDIVTDREAIDGCQVIVATGLGNAERIADDKASGLALLRVYGVRNLKPLALGDTPRSEVTLVGIADPQAQAGGAQPSAVRAAADSSGSLDPLPAPGFTGAAAIDPDNGFVGIVAQKPQVVAGPASAPVASLVPTDTIRRLLAAQGVQPASGRASADFARGSVVRVICVRK